MKRYVTLFTLLLSVILAFSACSGTVPGSTVPPFDDETSLITTTQNEFTSTTTEADTTKEIISTTTEEIAESVVTENSIPDYSGKAYITLNNNIPEFSKSEITTKAFEDYENLDYLGRCGVAFACLGLETMPKEERGEIGMIKPSGWHSVKYDCVDGKYLYNRCHLIGFQLSGENANERNLITGTRYLNIDGMLPFENMVADYIKETKNHVMYRVTPIFEGNNLLSKGVQMEAYSVEDNGDGICFNVFCYNAQPSIKINYETGESYLIVTTTTPPVTEETKNNISTTYILNTNSKKFHYSDCSSVKKISDKNKQEFNGDRNDLIADGYSACGVCKP